MTKETEERVDKLIKNAVDEEKRKTYRKLDGFEMIWIMSFITKKDCLSHEMFKRRVLSRFDERNARPANYKSISKVLLWCV